MFGLFGLLQRIRLASNPPVCAPADEGGQPIRFGILGAAAIAPAALILPARSHPEAIVYAVAARDKSKAEAYAQKHGIPHVFASYQELVDCPDIDAIYNPLPNGLHYEWTMKALQAGKHVLLEKPSCNTAEETRASFEMAEKKGLTLMEAFHYRFHPAVQKAKQILDSGELGAIRSISTNLSLPRGFFRPDDIRFRYDLGGGALMDVVGYTVSMLRYLASANPNTVTSATCTPLKSDPRIDMRTDATLDFPNGIKGNISCSFALPPTLGFIPAMPKMSAQVECEKGSLSLYNFVAPFLYHYIQVKHNHKDDSNKQSRTEKAYTFSQAGFPGESEAWWTTYRHQLNAFVDKIKGRTPQTWIEKQDSIANMESIEMIYEKLGMDSRPKSSYVASD